MLLIERRLTSQVRQVLLGATHRTAPHMKPQGISNTLWALAKLECKLDGECFAALLAAAERSAPAHERNRMLQTPCGLSLGSTPRRWRARCGARCCRRPSARRRA